MQGKDKPGVALQNLVATLERVLADQSGVIIDSPGFLTDKDTRQRREHDVLITWKQAHHSIVGAIECRDRSRKIGVNEIESFAKKCERTGVDVPMMVSSKGFATTARIKAASLGIRCLELIEAENFDWMGMEFFVEFRKSFAPIDVEAFFVDTAPALPFTLYDTGGAEMTTGHFVGIIEQALNLPDHLDELAGPTVPIKVLVNTTDWTGAGVDGVSHAVSHLLLISAITIERNVRPITLHSYSTADGQFDVATSPIHVGDKTGNIVFVKAKGGDIRVVLKIDE